MNTTNILESVKRTPASFLGDEDFDTIPFPSKRESRNDQETKTTQRLAMEDPCHLLISMEKDIGEIDIMDNSINKQHVEEEEEDNSTTTLTSVFEDFCAECYYETTTNQNSNKSKQDRNTPSSFKTQSSDQQKPFSPVSVVHVTDIHTAHNHHDDDALSSSSLDLPALLPEFDNDDDDDMCGNAASSSRKRSTSALDFSTTHRKHESTFIAPRWEHERKRFKQETKNMNESSSTTSLQEMLLTQLKNKKNNNNSPSLLEVAVGYGYHLAQTRLEHEHQDGNNNNDYCALTGILDPSRRVQDIVQDGAQTVLRMKDKERRLFWKYMMMSTTMNNNNNNEDNNNEESS